MYFVFYFVACCELHVCVCVCVCVCVLAVRARSLLARACVYMYVSACVLCACYLCARVRAARVRAQNFFLMLFSSYFVACCECVCVCVCLCARCTLALPVGVHPSTQPLPVLPLPVILVYRGGVCVREGGEGIARTLFREECGGGLGRRVGGIACARARACTQQAHNPKSNHSA